MKRKNLLTSLKRPFHLVFLSLLALTPMVGPALAGDLQPAAIPTLMETSGEVVASGQNGAGERTQAQIEGFNQLLIESTTSEGKDANDPKEAKEAPAQELHMDVITRNQDGTDAQTPAAWYISTDLYRSGGNVHSKGWTEAYPAIYYIRSGNYLCRNGSCTSWTYRGGHWLNWVWAGWTWKSGYANWYTRSQHYFNTSHYSYYYYTAKSASL